MIELALFWSTFILVFSLGIQSLNVNNGHRIAAMFTSFFIGSMQMVLFKLAPNADWCQIAAFLLGGPFGIYAAMAAHPYLVSIIKREKITKPRGQFPPKPAPSINKEAS
jgi:hypothetical protein